MSVKVYFTFIRGGEMVEETEVPGENHLRSAGEIQNFLTLAIGFVTIWIRSYALRGTLICKHVF